MEEKNGYFHQFKKKHCNYILSHTHNSVQYSKWDVNVIRSLYRKCFQEVHCLHDNVFRSGRWIGQFKDIKCTSLPWFSAEETSITCAGRHKLYR